MAFLCLVALFTGMFSKVYLVFGNKYLMKRDKKDFQTLWIMLDFVKSVEYCVGLNFGVEKGSLVLIDESDIVMFDSP